MLRSELSLHLAAAAYHDLTGPAYSHQVAAEASAASWLPLLLFALLCGLHQDARCVMPGCRSPWGFKYQVPYIQCQCLLKRCQALLHFGILPAPFACVAGLSDMLLSLPQVVDTGRLSTGPEQASAWAVSVASPDCRHNLCCVETDGYQCCERRRGVAVPDDKSKYLLQPLVVVAAADNGVFTPQILLLSV